MYGPTVIKLENILKDFAIQFSLKYKKKISNTTIPVYDQYKVSSRIVSKVLN